MKHASSSTLQTITSLLEKIRELPTLKEKKMGTFYLKSSAFLHFHEDPSGLYADYKVNKEWRRLKINTPEEQALLIQKLTEILN